MYSRMGGFLSNVARLVNTYNIEQRAHKTLTENRKVVPPKHPTTVPIIDQLKTEYADKYEELLRKNENLDKNLKDVYVKSFNENKSLPRNPDLLPKRTRYESPYEYGYEDPEEVPPGKYTLTQIIQILTEYHSDREENTVEKLAKEHNLDEQHLKNIVSYYKLFKLGRRPNKQKSITATTWSTKEDIGIRNIKKLPVGKKKKEEEKYLPEGKPRTFF